VSATAGDPTDLLEPLRADPGTSALLTDIDGTLSPIAERPGDASVLPEAREALALLAERFALVACVSGRSAPEARELVGLDSLTYIGNHGLERLEPGAPEPRISAALTGHEEVAGRFANGLGRDRLADAGLRLEDKGPIRALHWRGAPDDERAEAVALEIGAEAERAGLALHHGRKVLELRPPVEFDKGIAIVEAICDHGAEVRHALYAGDDRTDLDGFTRLRELANSGGLDAAVCVAIASSEAPHEVSAKADLVMPDPSAFASFLGDLAR
jgi:trehalose 6-phosphate phosphatase